MKKYIRLILIPVLLFVLSVPKTTAFASDRLFISQIRIQSGDAAAEELEAAGFTVIYQNLNPSGSERIYLGYQLGETPITGLVVSSEYNKSISVNGIAYTAVSELDLNGGTDGNSVYLYFTDDTKAGSGIVALSFVKDNKDGTADLLGSFGDGSLPVKTAAGAVADFDDGLDSRSLYLFAVCGNLCLPYVSEIKTVNVGANENAFEKIVESGCAYFIEEPVFQKDGTDTYLCYNRTADSANAVRNASVSDNAVIDGITYTFAGSLNQNGEGTGLYYTKDENTGSPVVQITKGLLFSGTVTSGDWAASFFGGSSLASPYIYEEEAYASLLNSSEEYVQLAVKSFCDGKSGQESGLYMILSADAVNTENGAFDAVTLPAQTQGETEELVRDTEITGIEKERSPEIVASGEKPVNNSGSAIGGGSLIAIAVLAIISVIIAFIFVTLKGRKKDSEI